MTAGNGRMREEELYEPVKKYLIGMLKRNFTKCHLEITHRGGYSETLKHVVEHDIIFTFLKEAPPDLVGFVLKEGADERNAGYSDVRSYITVEVKPSKLKLDDIYQAKKYGDLFCAKYALLISPYPIGEEIRRLQERLGILNRHRGWSVYVGQISTEKEDRSIVMVKDSVWFPATPF